MDIGVLGISHQEADLNSREDFSRQLKRALAHLVEKQVAHVPLFTCNRAEIYIASEAELYLLHKELESSCPSQFYTFFGADCFTHLSSVAAGLKSAELFESDIQRQVKIAYTKTAEQIELPAILHYLFQKSLQIAKEVRTISYRGAFATSLSMQVQKTIQAVFGKECFRILFIGNSAINRQLMQALKCSGINELFLCSRAATGSEAFFGLLPWSSLELWKNFELVVAASEAQDYLLHATDLLAAQRSTRLIIDLAVPRNVDPAIADCGIQLCNIEDLNRQMIQSRKGYHEHMIACQDLVQTQVEAKLESFLKRRQLAYSQNSA